MAERVRINRVMKQALKLGVYRHFKGNLYQVIGIAKHTETMEELVIYRSLENPKKVWARPLKMFLEKVRVNGKLVLRFTAV